MRARVERLLLAVGLLFGASTACRKPPEPGERKYPLTGVVASVNRAVREVVVAHDDVPGFMPAMTMPFPIDDDALLVTLKRGDQIAGTLVVGETRYRLEGVKVTRVAPADLPAPASPGPLVEPDAGTAVPDVALVNQGGRKIRLSDYRGKALAVTFVFTRCPLPDFCPRMGTRFAAVAEMAGSEVALRDRVQLLTVTFDPKFDTPEVLRRWGQRYSKSALFELATGEPEEIRRLASFLSLEYDEEAGGGFTHNLRTAVIGPDGTLFRLHRGNDGSPEELLADLRASLRP